MLLISQSSHKKDISTSLARLNSSLKFRKNRAQAGCTNKPLNALKTEWPRVVKAKGTRVDRGAATTQIKKSTRCAAFSKQGTKSSNDGSNLPNEGAMPCSFCSLQEPRQCGVSFAVVRFHLRLSVEHCGAPALRLLALRCARCGCDKNLMRLGGKGMQAFRGCDEDMHAK